MTAGPASSVYYSPLYVVSGDSTADSSTDVTSSVTDFAFCITLIQMAEDSGGAVGRAIEAILGLVDVSDPTADMVWGTLNIQVDFNLSELAVEVTDQGEFVLVNNWEDFWGGAIDNFLDYFLVRKLMGPADLRKKAPGVLRKWFNWSFEQKLFDQEHYADYLLALPKSKAKQIDRLERAGKLLFDLQLSNDPETVFRYDNVIPILQDQEPDDFVEGMVVVTQIDPDIMTVFDEGGIEYSIHIGDKLSKYLRGGDQMYLELALFNKSWIIVGSGNVYPEGG